jgi:branched-chain amino acid transport system permease protein/urea transport system permease protein
VIIERAASHWAYIGGFNGLFGVPPLRLPFVEPAIELVAAAPSYLAMLAAAALVYLFLLWIERSPLGTVLRSLRDGDERTAYFGYDVAAYKVFAFTLSGGIAGLAGALFATQFGFVSPALIGFALSTEVLIWVALGGRDVLLAALLGAVLVRSVESALSERLGNFWLLALGILFVLSVVFLPRGLFGWALVLPMPKRLLGGAGRRG